MEKRNLAVVFWYLISVHVIAITKGQLFANVDLDVKILDKLTEKNINVEGIIKPSDVKDHVTNTIIGVSSKTGTQEVITSPSLAVPPAAEPEEHAPVPSTDISSAESRSASVPEVKNQPPAIPPNPFNPPDHEANMRKLISTIMANGNTPDSIANLERSLGIPPGALTEKPARQKSSGNGEHGNQALHSNQNSHKNHNIQHQNQRSNERNTRPSSNRENSQHNRGNNFHQANHHENSHHRNDYHDYDNRKSQGRFPYEGRAVPTTRNRQSNHNQDRDKSSQLPDARNPSPSNYDRYPQTETSDFDKDFFKEFEQNHNEFMKDFNDFKDFPRSNLQAPASESNGFQRNVYGPREKNHAVVNQNEAVIFPTNNRRSRQGNNEYIPENKYREENSAFPNSGSQGNSNNYDAEFRGDTGNGQNRKHRRPQYGPGISPENESFVDSYDENQRQRERTIHNVRPHQNQIGSDQMYRKNQNPSHEDLNYHRSRMPDVEYGNFAKSASKEKIGNSREVLLETNNVMPLESSIKFPFPSDPEPSFTDFMMPHEQYNGKQDIGREGMQTEQHCVKMLSRRGELMSQSQLQQACHNYRIWGDKMHNENSWQPSPAILTWWDSLATPDSVTRLNDLPKVTRLNDLQNIKSLNDLPKAKTNNFPNVTSLKEFPRNNSLQDLETARDNDTLSHHRHRRSSLNYGTLRKEYRMMRHEERQAFHKAVNVLKTQTIDKISKYDIFTYFHHPRHAPSAYFGPAFYGWHREYLLRFERALQAIDASVFLPYWDSSMDGLLGDQAADSVMWTESFAGNAYGQVMTGPFAEWRVPMASTGKVSLQRNLGWLDKPSPKDTSKLPIQDSTVNKIMFSNSLRSISWYVEPGVETDIMETLNWISGSMSDLVSAPADPLFFMHFAFIDCIWEQSRLRKLTEEPHFEFRSDYPNDTEAVGVGMQRPDGIEAHRLQDSFHAALHEMRPFGPLKNIDGVDGDYSRLYACAPRPMCTQKYPHCNSPYLFCDRSLWICVPRLQLNTDCSRFRDHNPCYNAQCCNMHGNYQCLERCSELQEGRHFQRSRPHYRSREAYS